MAVPTKTNKMIPEKTGCFSSPVLAPAVNATTESQSRNWLLLLCVYELCRYLPITELTGLDCQVGKVGECTRARRAAWSL